MQTFDHTRLRDGSIGSSSSIPRWKSFSSTNVNAWRILGRVSSGRLWPYADIWREKERERERDHSLGRFIARWLGVGERAGKVCTMHDIASIAISGRYRARRHSVLALSALSPLRRWIDLFDAKFRSSFFAFPATHPRVPKHAWTSDSEDGGGFIPRLFLRAELRYYRYTRPEGVEAVPRRARRLIRRDWRGVFSETPRESSCEIRDTASWCRTMGYFMILLRYIVRWMYVMGHEDFLWSIPSPSLSLSLFCGNSRKTRWLGTSRSLKHLARSINVPITETDMFIHTLAADAFEWMPIAILCVPILERSRHASSFISWRSSSPLHSTNQCLPRCAAS